MAVVHAPHAQGFAGVVQPYGGKRYLVSLRPQDVDCFVFWSKDFTPFVPHLDTLDRLGYRFYFNYTLTALPAVFETDVDKAAALQDAQVSQRALLAPAYQLAIRPDRPVQHHRRGFYLDAFERLAAQLAGRVERCYFSFVTEYREGQTQPPSPARPTRASAFFNRTPKRRSHWPTGWRRSPTLRHPDALLLRRLPAQRPDSQGPLHRRRDHRAVVLSAGSDVQGEAHAQGVRLHGEHRHRDLRHLPARLPLLLRQRQQGRSLRGLPWHDPDSAFLGFGKSQSDAWIAEIRRASLLPEPFAEPDCSSQP